MTIVNTYTRPKQRMTRDYSILIIEGSFGFTVHKRYNDDMSLADGSYDLTYAQALKEFLTRIEKDARSYPPACNEVK